MKAEDDPHAPRSDGPHERRDVDAAHPLSGIRLAHPPVPAPSNEQGVILDLLHDIDVAIRASIAPGAPAEEARVSLDDGVHFRRVVDLTDEDVDRALDRAPARDMELCLEILCGPELTTHREYLTAFCAAVQERDHQPWIVGDVPAAADDPGQPSPGRGRLPEQS